VLATRGNLNNHLGLPLTLLSLRAAHRAAVVEVGANHVGEIAQLTPLVHADTVMISSIGFAHVGEFGGIDAVIRAKGEILQSLSADQVAVVPVLAAEDVCDGWSVWQEDAMRAQAVVFGHLHHVKAVRGWDKWIGLVSRRATDGGQSVQLASSDWGGCTLLLPVLGAHQAMNVAAVSAALLMRGYSWQQIQQGLMQVHLPSGRLHLMRLSDQLTVIDDSYNANPSSMLAAIDVLMEQSASVKILVVGDMAELGDSTEEWHTQLGQSAQQAGVQLVLAMGQYAKQVMDGFGELGLVMTEIEIIAQTIMSHVQVSDSVCVLIKGSRSSRMERVVDALQALLKK
jgi:UDP-N-acetylmuramoyl-tripeptide--D-alanyl-D-alanine ligase